MASKIDNALRFQQQALGLRAQRQQVLASNIANADTPHYKARDIDFASALSDALAGRSGDSLRLATTSSRHIDGGGGPFQPTLLYRRDYQSAVDGNTVDMDVERAQFAENAVYYEAAVTFVSQKLRGLSSAIAPGQ